jgi:hypothetical protein
MRRRLAILLVLLFFVVSGFIVRNRLGLAVIVKNDSDTRLQAVRVVAPGGIIDLGSMPPRSRRIAFPKAQGESSATLQFQDARGAQHSAVIVGYFEAGYCGTTAVSVSTAKIDVKQSIDPAICLGSWESVLKLYL